MLHIVSKLHYAVAETQKSRLCQNSDVSIERKPQREDCYQLKGPTYPKSFLAQYKAKHIEAEVGSPAHVNIWLRSQAGIK